MAARQNNQNNIDPVVRDDWGTEKLRKLAQDLISYRAPLNFLGKEDDDDGAHAIVTPSLDFTREYGDIISRFPKELGKKKAAVLICLFQDDNGEFRVILTKRAKTLSSHSGEVALPGGKRDEQDINNADTALREAFEEIGLNPLAVRVVTYLEPYLSKHLLRVTPVVALVPDKSNLAFTLNPNEVDAVFDAPLEMFLKDKHHRSEERQWYGLSYRVHYFDFVVSDAKYLIWGLTASILIRCASIVYQRSPEFVETTSFVPITNHVPI